MKVLWVDNDPSVVEGTQLIAEQYGIDLPCFKNWEDAQKELEDNFGDYSAIVLDANCEFGADSVEDKTFLAYVMPRIAKLFGEQHAELPWYVLSAGTMDEFDLVLQLVNTDDRKRHNDDWGKLLYYKDKRYDDGTTDLDSLFRNIRKSHESSHTARIHSLYGDVFRTIADPRNMLDKEVEELLLPILTQLHFPETIKESTSYASFTQLRQVLEYLFRACNRTGLLADECIPKGKVNLQESINYLGGQDCRFVKVRYGSAGRGDFIFPELITDTLQQILRVANACTHTADEVPGKRNNVTEYLETAGALRKLQSYALELCNVIVWYGKYVAKHPNAKENRKWCHSVKKEEDLAQCQPATTHRNQKTWQRNNSKNGNTNHAPEAKATPANAADTHTYEYRIVAAECDENGRWHSGPCLILPKGPIKRGEKLEICEIEENRRATRDRYPLIARNYTKCDSTNSTPDRSEYAIFPRKDKS